MQPQKNLKDLSVKANDIAAKFIEEQKLEFKQVEQNQDLQSRKKQRREKAMKCGCAPWHVSDENDSNSNNNTDAITNNSNNDNDNATLDNSQNSDNAKNNDQSLKEELKSRILKVSEDEENFLIEAPTSESVFEFNIDTALPYANASLKQDPNLQKVRFQLVPKKISEKQFWKNYFYRVQLIRESMGVKKLDLSADAEVPLDQVLVNEEIEQQNSEKNGASSYPNDVVVEKSMEEDEELKRLPDVKIASNDNSNLLSAHHSSVGIVAPSSTLNHRDDAIARNSTKESNGKQAETETRHREKMENRTVGKERGDVNDDEDNDFVENVDPDIGHLSAEERQKMKQELGLADKILSDGNDEVNVLLEEVDDNGEEIDEAELANIVSEVGSL